jgi:hypothetical protein
VNRKTFVRELFCWFQNKDRLDNNDLSKLENGAMVVDAMACIGVLIIVCFKRVTLAFHE